MKTKYVGLSDQEVEESRLKYGENVMTPPAKKSLWLVFFEKFKDPLIVVLLVAAVLSLGISFYEYFVHGSPTAFLEPVGIFVAVFLSTGLSFFFEHKAEGEFEILNKVNDHEKVKVYRNGKLTEEDKSKIVVGDILVLSSGDEICADAVLCEATGLRVDESSLTGESSCNKTTDEKEFDSEATFPSNKVYKGSNVLEGEAVCKVFAVGDRTEAGKVFAASQIDNSIRTPLNEQLEKLGGVISKISYCMAFLLLAGRLVIFFFTMTSFDWIEFLTYMLQSLMIAITLVVVAVPEGLPMAVTLSLAYSMQKLLKSKSLVRRMHACETMGAVNVICTDKTGTLTQNQMTVASALFPEHLKADKFVAESLSLNSSAYLDCFDDGKIKVIGNPTEGALLLWLKDEGDDYMKYRNETETLEKLPFTTENKYMATVIHSNVFKKKILLVKGAPEIVLQMCTSFEQGFDREGVRVNLSDFQNKAMRTLVFAYRELDDDKGVIKDGKLAVRDLCFMGMVGITDPVRAGVADAVKECLNAGIDIKVVTGDTSVTAKAIAEQIGLLQGTNDENSVITGEQLSSMPHEDLKKRIKDLKIISRARPMDKKLLVETLQEEGCVVAVTGDGTNDAPALKSAQVGLSMGDGTNVAKQASDITITDNSFNSIVRAVMWGRSLYQNIQRFILFQMTINVVACFIVLFGAFMGKESPLTVTQMLWVNLIMDTFAAMALASLPPDERVMNNPPRKRKDFIITKSMRKGILGVGAVFFVVLMGLLYIFQHYDIRNMKDILLFDGYSATARLSDYEKSLFFTIFVLMQFWNMFNAKAYLSKRDFFHFKNCNSFLFIAALILVGQVFIVSFGGKMFDVTPIQLQDWFGIIVSTSLVLIIGEVTRFVKRHTKA